MIEMEMTFREFKFYVDNLFLETKGYARECAAAEEFEEWIWDTEPIIDAIAKVAFVEMLAGGEECPFEVVWLELGVMNGPAVLRHVAALWRTYQDMGGTMTYCEWITTLPGNVQDAYSCVLELDSRGLDTSRLRLVMEEPGEDWHLDEGMIRSWLEGPISDEMSAEMALHMDNCPTCSAAAHRIALEIGR